MARDNVANYATTTLSGNISNTATSFTVATGGGAQFPTVSSTNPSSFIVSIDTELILCSARSGDTFTVASGGRGYEGTGAASHTSGAIVIQSPTAGTNNHLWSNVPDTLIADVPPYARGGSAPSTWDDEFENQAAAWQIYPAPSGGDQIDFNVVKSCLRFRRADFSNTTYTVYKPFAPGGTSQPWTVMCKMSHGARTWGMASNIALIPHFFVSDQSVPVNISSGNEVRAEHHISEWQLSTTYPNTSTAIQLRFPVIDIGYTISGSASGTGYVIGTGYTYFKLICGGSGTIYAWYGDGSTWNLAGSVNVSFVPATIGWRFYVTNGTGSRSSEEIVIDWLRCYLTSTQTTSY